MCGIAGFVSRNAGPNNSKLEAVRRMTDRMSPRGPDAVGVWSGDGVVLGHRRLAILDLDPRSNQPMISSDGNYSISFNGEIYNFRALREELETQGVTFRTTSDTEVLLALYARDGEGMLPRLRGMFALAIWDLRSRELFLARDPYGIKPLYYSAVEGGLIFASQVKALVASGLISTEPESAGVAGFYLWGSVPEPWTLYRGVYSVPAGSWLRVQGGVASAPVRWNDIRKNWQQPPHRQSNEEMYAHVRKAVTESVRAHLVSDVPVSVFLSGGIDSGAIAGLAAQLGAKVEGITVAFDEFASHPQDEAPLAAVLAAHYGLPHHVRRVERSEFEQDLPAILNAMDQPSIDGVNTWFASKAAAEQGFKVVLSGVGGDELFYGYALMTQIPQHALLGGAIAAIPGARALLKAPFTALAKGRRHPKLKGVPEFMGSLEGAYFLKRCLFLPQELPSLMGAEAAREGIEKLGGSPPGMSKANAVNGGGAVCLLDSTLYLRNQLLRDSDWASMEHSLELRTPLVDAKLLEELQFIHTSFTGGEGKKMLANAPLRPLPESIIHREKSGFEIPITEWLAASTNLHDWAGSPLLEPSGTPWTRRWAKTVMDTFLPQK